MAWASASHLWCELQNNTRCPGMSLLVYAQFPALLIGVCQKGCFARTKAISCALGFEAADAKESPRFPIDHTLASTASFGATSSLTPLAAAAAHRPVATAIQVSDVRYEDTLNPRLGFSVFGLSAIFPLKNAQDH